MLEELNRVLWGPLGVGLLGAAGLWLTVRTGWFQLRQARLWLDQTLGALLAGSPELDRQGGDSISPLQSLCTDDREVPGQGLQGNVKLRSYP